MQLLPPFLSPSGQMTVTTRKMAAGRLHEEEALSNQYVCVWLILLISQLNTFTDEVPSLCFEFNGFTYR